MTDNPTTPTSIRHSGKKNQMMRDVPMRILVADKSVLRIEIGLGTLQCVADNGPSIIRVLDIDKLAAELVVILAHDEDETGRTPLMRVIDDAIEMVAEDGSTAIEERGIPDA
jgi:hypothetical protein